MHAQGAARRVDLILEVGAVDALDGRAGVQQPFAASQLVGKGVLHGPEPVQDEVDDLLQLPARDRAGGRVDRDREVRGSLGGQSCRLLVVEELVVGVGELLGPAVLAHLAREDAPTAGLQVFQAPRLIEERQRQLTLAVADHDLQQRALAILHAPFARAAHLRDDRHGFAHRERRDRGQLTAPRIAAGIVRQEVADGPHAEGLLERVRGFSPDGAVEARFEGQGRHAPSLGRRTDEGRVREARAPSSASASVSEWPARLS